MASPQACPRSSAGPRGHPPGHSPNTHRLITTDRGAQTPPLYVEPKRVFLGSRHSWEPCKEKLHPPHLLSPNASSRLQEKSSFNPERAWLSRHYHPEQPGPDSMFHARVAHSGSSGFPLSQLCYDYWCQVPPRHVPPVNKEACLELLITPAGRRA